MEFEFCYNPNVGAASRGTKPDVENITIQGHAVDGINTEADIVGQILTELGENIKYYLKGYEESLEDLIRWADDRDIGAGDPILFWVVLKSGDTEDLFESDWEPDSFEATTEVTDLFAVNIAFPKLSDESKNTIADWYCIEGTAEDFETNEDYAAYITRDIISMLYAGDYTGEEEMALQQDLVACGYFDKEELPGFEDDVERITEDYHHPNASICDCSSCGRPSSEVDIHTVADFVGDTYDLDDFCEVEAIDPAETICAECFEQAEADYLKATEPSEYNDNGIDLRTGEPWGEYQWYEPELNNLED